MIYLGGVTMLLDRNKIYGYSDEIMLEKEPEDNTIMQDGFDDVLSVEEVHKYFPNQKVLLEVVEHKGMPGNWIKAKVLKYHCSSYDALMLIVNDNKDRVLLCEPTYSEKVGGSFDL